MSVTYESNNLRAVHLFKTKEDYDTFVNELEAKMNYFKGPFFQNGWVTGEYDDIDAKRNAIAALKRRVTRKRKLHNH